MADANTPQAGHTLLQSQALASFFFVLHRNVVEEFKKGGHSFPIAIFYHLKDADAYANAHDLSDDLMVVDLHGISIHTEVCENCGTPCNMKQEYHLYNEAMSNECETHFYCNKDACQHCVQDEYRVCAEGHCRDKHSAYEGGETEREILIDKEGKNFPDPNQQKCARCIAEDAGSEKVAPKVIISVLGGIAEVMRNDSEIDVEIRDYDNEDVDTPCASCKKIRQCRPCFNCGKATCSECVRGLGVGDDDGGCSSCG